MFRKGKRNVSSGPVSSIFFFSCSVFFLIFLPVIITNPVATLRAYSVRNPNNFRIDVIDIIRCRFHKSRLSGSM